MDASCAEDFYMYDDGENRVLFCMLYDEEVDRRAEGMPQTVLQGKTVDGIVMRDADQMYYDRPQV